MAIHVTIDGYDILDQIGVGGMAAVYKARQISIDKIVAVKVLFPYLASDESFTERFQREAKAAAKIQHENIVNVIDFGESEGSYFIVMEYYEGQTLEDLLKNHQSLPFDVAVSVLLEVCYGLESAHGKDIVHRDIKPGNIIYTYTGGIKIADFGLAKKTDAMTMITQQGKVIGTPAYMSPEQAAGHNVGGASDIFSLGVVAYELLCQHKPFEGSSYSEVLEKIQTHEPPALANINPLVQPDFETIVTKMLEKDEAKRYRSASEVVADLEAGMEKFRISRDRRRLSKYISDPEAYVASFNEKVITRCLSQGAYYMQKGQGHLEDAALEFKRILHLDPDNQRAKKNLQRVLAERGKDKTVSIDARDGGSRAGKEPKAGRTITVVAASGKRKRRRKAPLITTTIAALMVLLGWFGYTRGYFTLDVLGGGNGSPAVSAPSNISARAGETVEFVVKAVDPESDAVRMSADGLPEGATFSEKGEFVWKVGPRQSGSVQVTFVADDGNSSARTRTVIDVAGASNSLEFTRVGTVSITAGNTLRKSLRAKSPSGERVSFKLVNGPDGMKVDGSKLVWAPNVEQKGTFKATVKASDGYASESQTVTVRVKPAAAPAPKNGKVVWKLPEAASIYIDGTLKRSQATEMTADLPRGKHTLQAELVSGITGWSEVVDIQGGKTTTLHASALDYGELSVYFLGGVGELHINGKAFAQQPPFSGVRLPVGVHPAACRMKGGGETHEFTIKIEKGKETIVEYELGNSPVVSIEG